MIVDGKDTSIFGKNTFFPADFKGTVSFGKMWDYKIVDITINPYLYNPVQKKLRKLTGGVVTVSFPTKKKSKAATGKRAGWVEDKLAKKLANPQALETYGVAAESASLTRTLVAPLASTSTFVIITTNEIRSGSTQFAAFKSFLDSNYNDVLVATQTDYGVGATADARARNIRQWLIANKNVDTWHYVLLIGNPDHASGDVPMKEFSHVVEGKLEFYGTDYCFAELTGDWDAGVFDKDPELAVGRIPVYTDPATGKPNFVKLNKILLKTQNYEQATDVEWRRFALLPVMPSFPGDDFTFAESIINTTLKPNQWQYLRLYDSYSYLYFNFVEKLSNMTVIPEVPFCSQALVTENWNTFNPGIVAWFTHGNPIGAVGILNSYPDLSSTVRLLNDQKPAIVFALSCLTSSDQDSNNLGSETVYNNAVAYVGATASIYPTFGRWAGTEFTKDITAPLGPMSVGDALMDLYSTNPDLYALTLYGCPDVALNLKPVGLSPTPQSISAQTISSGQIDLFWSAVIPAPNKYIVYRGDASATRVAGFSQIAQVIAPATTYQDLSVTPETKYKYRVCAIDNIDSSSGYSPIDSATTLKLDNSSKLPGMVSGLTANAGCYQATLNWTGDPNATSYNIKKSRSASGPFVTIFNVTATTYTDINLLNAIDYYYVVSAVNEFGQSADYPVSPNECKVTPQLTAVSAGPTSPRFENVKHNSFQYCWTNNTIYDVLKIEVELIYTKEVVELLVTDTLHISYPRTHENYSISDLDDNQSVSFRVMATNGYGSTAWTSPISVTTTTGTKPGFPINFTTTQITPELLTLSWSPSLLGSATDGYQIYHKPADGSNDPFTLLGEYPSTTTSMDFNTCEATTDSFSIRAFHVETDGKVYSSYSPKFVVTTGSWPLLAPSDLATACLSANQIKLMWTDNSTTETGFRIERRDVTANGSWSEIVTTTPNATQYLDVSVVSDNEYEYRVRANCAPAAIPGFSAWAGPVDGSTKVADNDPQELSISTYATSSTAIKLSYDCYPAGGWPLLNNVVYTIQWSTLHPDNPDAPPPEASFQTLVTQPYNILEYLKTGLTSGVTYWFRVRAQNWVGIIDWETVSSKTGPNAPTGLSAVALSGSQVNLSWTDNSNDETGFAIEHNIPAFGTDWYGEEGAYTNPNITTFGVTYLQANTIYKFRVRANNSFGCSSSSNEVTITTPTDACVGIMSSGGGLQGTVFGVTPPRSIGSEYCKASDGDINTYFDYSQANSGYTGINGMGSVGKIRYYPRAGYASRMVGGKFQGSSTSSYSGFVDLYTIATTPTMGWNEVLLPNPASYYWVRYLSPDGGYCNIAEMEFYDQYIITASAGTLRGSISPSGSNRMDAGVNQTYTITPTSGNQIDAVWVDGENKGPITSYQFLDVRYNHTIFATFKNEAENAALSGGASPSTSGSGFSGTGYVDGFCNSNTAQVTFTENVTTAGSYKVKLRYSAGNGTNATTGLYVNGVKIKNITCPATADWNTWANEVETVTLNAGTNTITYKAETISTNCINLDYISLLYIASFTWEAENATLSGTAGTNTNHGGFSGTGFVEGFWKSTTAQVTFNSNVAYGGNYEVKLRYSAGNGISTNIGLYVNGVKIKNITCPTTANWDTWADEVETVTLNAGINTIAYKSETVSSYPINLDKLTLTSVTAPSQVAVVLQVNMRDQTLGSNLQSQPRFYIQNTGTVPLSNFTMKYYFTVESGKTPAIENYFMSSYPGTLQQISGNEWCVVVNFTTTLSAGGGRIPTSDGLNFGLHYSNWESVWNQSNDFSQPTSSSYVLNGKVAIFNSSNELVYGSIP